jgi:hypothetical protein
LGARVSIFEWAVIIALAGIFWNLASVTSAIDRHSSQLANIANPLAEIGDALNKRQ